MTHFQIFLKLNDAKFFQDIPRVAMKILEYHPPFTKEFQLLIDSVL